MRKKESKKRKKYVTKAEVEEGLHRGCVTRKDGSTWWNSDVGTWGCNPGEYIRYLRRETNLSYPKIAHDLRVDSGCDVSDGTVAKWGREKCR